MKGIALFTCLSLFFFFHHQSLAQSQEYLKGYMITTTQDTVYGYIKDDRRVNLLDQFSFKENLQATAKNISIFDATAFYFEPSFYFDLVDLSSGDTEQRKFLRKIVDGYVDLYQYPNDGLTDYVLIRENGEKLLIAKRDVASDTEYREDKRYFGQLKYFFKDCKDIAANTNSINYDEKTLKNLVKQYNKCIRPNEQDLNLEEKRKLKIQLGLNAGYNLYTIETLINQPPKIPTEAKGNTLQFGGMISLSYFRKLSLKTGVLYTKYNSDYEEDFSLGVRKISHEIEALEFPIYLKYNLTNGKITPYLIGGMRFGKALNANSSEMRIAVTDDILFDEAYELTFTRIFGYSAGAGLSMKLGRTDIDLALTYGVLEMTLGVEVDVIVSGLNLNGSIYF